MRTHLRNRIRNLPYPTGTRIRLLPESTVKVNASWMAWYRSCLVEGLR